MSSYVLGLLAFLGINTLLAYSVYIPLATRQFSLGNAGFMAIGAYVASVLTVNARWPLPLALLGGALMAAVAGLVVGFPALRLRGLYLAMATLAFGEMVRAFFLNFEPTGGGLGFRGMQLIPEWSIWVCVVLVSLLLVGLSRSRLGLAMQATSDDDLAAELVGLNTVAIRVGAFVLGAAVAGLAGGLYAHYALFIEPGHFGFLLSIDVALMVILGGMFTPWGAPLGAAIFTLLPEALRDFAAWRGVVFGVLLLLVLLLRPGGILPRGFLEPRWRRLPESALQPAAPEPEPEAAAARGSDARRR